MGAEHKCLNCGHSFNGNYCPECGQSAHTKRIEWHYLWHDFQHFAHLDNSLFYTAWHLLKRPGKAIHEFIKGQRVGYFGPLSTVLTLAGIYILLYHVAAIDPLNILGQMIYLLNHLVYDGNLDFPTWIVDNYAYMELLIFLPMFSLASYIIFKKANHSFYEHVAVNAFLSAQRMLIGILTLPILLLFKGSSFSVFGEYTVSIFELGITIWAYMTFFTGFKRPKRFFMTLLTLLMVFVQLAVVQLIFYVL